MLTFSGLHWAAAIAGTSLPDLALTLPKSYLIGKAALYGLLSLGLAIGLFFGHPWAPSGTRWTGLVILIWTALERLIFSTSEYATRTIPATMIIALLIWGALVLALRRPSVRDFFQEYPV
ncbi:MAG: hypothetical protein MUP44_08620 [Anaerolineales bacterium]|nr:hypothetical protein [Anaerolineales bacterium]